MIELKELLPKGVELDQIPTAHQMNLILLQGKLNALRAEANFPWIVSSGYRTLEHHEDIYRQKNDARIKAGLLPLSIPLGSHHLDGQAADIADPNGKLQHWVLDHLELLEELGLYCESFESCMRPSRWVHLQCVAPKSGNRFFFP